MPGVPTSKGCEACRKQKKKCDQAYPVCSRCRRLIIPCIGAGRKRYVFHDQRLRGSTSTSFTQVSRIRQILDMNVPSNLDSANSRSAQSLVNIWRIPDLRYDISIFGDYFLLVPRRLGCSEALDAAAWAFTCAHPTLYTKTTTPEALTAYTRGLTKLREAINDPVKRRSQDTLCALHMMNSAQVLISTPDDQYVNHTSIMAHLLPDMLSQQWIDQFGKALLIYSAIIVIVGAMMTSRIDPDIPGLLQFLQKYSPPRPLTSLQGNRLPSFELAGLVRYPFWVKSPMRHRGEMRDAYKQVLLDIEELDSRLENLQLQMEPDDGHTIASGQSSNRDQSAEEFVRIMGIPMKKYLAQMQSAQTMALASAIFLNATLRAIEDPQDLDQQLINESSHLTEHVCQLSAKMMHLRPLYSSGIGITLVAAYGAERDTAKRKELAEWIDLFNIACVGEDWLNGAGWFETYLAKWKQETLTTIEAAREDSPGQKEIQRAHTEAPDPMEIFSQVESEHPIGRCSIL